jgi:hypothetical protein
MPGEPIRIEIVGGDLGGSTTPKPRTPKQDYGGLSEHQVVDISKGSLGTLGSIIGTATGGPAGGLAGGIIGGVMEDTLIGKAAMAIVKFPIQGGAFGMMLKKAWDNSEMAKGIKKLANEGFGAIGDALLYAGWLFYDKGISPVLNPLIAIGTALSNPVGFIIKIAGLADDVDSLATWVEEQFTSGWGRWKEYITGGDNKFSWEDLINTAALLTPLSLFDFGPGKDQFHISDLITGKMSLSDIFQFPEGESSYDTKSLFDGKLGVEDVFAFTPAGQGWFLTDFFLDKLGIDDVFKGQKWRLADLMNTEIQITITGVEDKEGNKAPKGKSGWAIPGVTTEFIDWLREKLSGEEEPDPYETV